MKRPNAEEIIDALFEVAGFIFLMALSFALVSAGVLMVRHW